ncbi:MAG: helix-turn-helix transcriptional regulator [Mycobacterium sp.]|nr:helix-turn-helix transcriptional regulator [Mycobacterium sp.]
MRWDAASAKKFGATLRGLRAERGLSQESLAHRSGVSTGVIQHLEAGRATGGKNPGRPSNPSMDILFKIAYGLALSPSEVVAAVEAPAGTSPGTPGKLTPNEHHEWVDAVEQLRAVTERISSLLAAPSTGTE